MPLLDTMLASLLSVTVLIVLPHVVTTSADPHIVKKTPPEPPPWIRYESRPIIGIVAQETHGDEDSYLGDSKIDADYVKYIEQAAARVVPIRIRESEEYYSDIFYKINGLLFPGGSVNLDTSGYANATRFLYELAIDANDQGDYFPVWGTCLGFEQLMRLAADHNIMTNCSAENMSLPLDFSADYRDSRMFQNAPDDIVAMLSQSNITSNNHYFCLTQQKYNATESLKGFYRTLSTNHDKNGLHFVSSAEAISYPFYAVQWHPEKNNYDWQMYLQTNHSEGAARVSQFLANFLVMEARKNGHFFPDYESEAEALIQNCPSHFRADRTFRQTYYFNYTHSTHSNTEQGYFTHRCLELMQSNSTKLLLLMALLIVCWMGVWYLYNYHDGAGQSEQTAKLQPQPDIQFLIPVSGKTVKCAAKENSIKCAP